MELWPSPISEDMLVGGSTSISETACDAGSVFWGERRATNAGRTTIVRWFEGHTEDVTGSDVDVRTRVHEYGGGAWSVRDSLLVYADDQRDGALFVLNLESGEETQITTAGHRYADGRLSVDLSTYVCVRERHINPGDGPADAEAVSVVNDVVAISLDDGTERVVFEGHDFYSSPRISPGGQIVCIAWNHPNMPWNNTSVLVRDGLEESARTRTIASGDEAFAEPGWTSNSALVVATDLSNWWNLVELSADSSRSLITTGQHEVATPPWVFGMQRWCELNDGIAWVAGTPQGDVLHVPSGPIKTDHSSIDALVSFDGSAVCYVAASWSEGPAVWMHDGASATRLSAENVLPVDDRYFPAPELVRFEVGDTHAEAHTLFYEPANPDRPAEPTDGPAPLLVMVHGGPTGAARRQLNLSIRYWTSRGVAVADVDYRGSVLYGRTYRHSLDKGWGLLDVVDCVACAHHLAAQGRVDRQRMVIAGGSAGGLTVLNALAHHEVFAGGISRYGVTDLRSLATDTHKFEARYLDRLVGPWPDAEQEYIDRSPMSRIDKIDKPLLVLQGTEDEIVPPSQAEMLVSSLNNRGVDVTYLLFEGEGHGFRKAETVTAVLQAEAEFIAGL